MPRTALQALDVVIKHAQGVRAATTPRTMALGRSFLFYAPQDTTIGGESSPPACFNTSWHAATRHAGRPASNPPPPLFRACPVHGVAPAPTTPPPPEQRASCVILPPAS